MGLAFRNAFTIAEIAARWDATPARVAEWALGDALRLTTVVPIVEVTGTAEPIDDLAEAPGGDLWPLFRAGNPLPSVQVRRVRASGSTAWGRVVDPHDGLAITIADVHVTAVEVDRIERDTSPATTSTGWRGQGGRPPTRDGDTLYGWQRAGCTIRACRPARPSSSARRSTGSASRATRPCPTRAPSGESSPGSGARWFRLLLNHCPQSRSLYEAQATAAAAGCGPRGLGMITAGQGGGSSSSSRRLRLT